MFALHVMAYLHWLWLTGLFSDRVYSCIPLGYKIGQNKGLKKSYLKTYFQSYMHIHNDLLTPKELTWDTWYLSNDLVTVVGLGFYPASNTFFQFHQTLLFC